MNRSRVDRRIAGLAGERRFQLLVEGVKDCAIYMLDPEGIVSSWNSGAELIKGYSAAEIIGQHFSRFFTPKERATGVPQQLLATARAAGHVETEGWRVRKDGSRFWALGVVEPITDEVGNFIGFAKITRDMTEREAARRALAESERQLRLLVRGVTDYALFMLDPNGLVTTWNVGAEKIKGYESDEILGKHFSCFYTPADRLAGVPRKALETAAATGRSEAEGLRVRKDGSQFWASVVIDAIRDEDGALIGFAKITRDVTKQKKAQETLQKAQEQLALNQKMEALGQLTGGIAHDFNNLLMVVGGQIEMLKSRVSSERDARALDAMEQAVKHGARLTRQMLAFARANPVNSAVVDLRERIDSMRELLASLTRSDIGLVIDIAADIWPVLIDTTEFELALVNLAVNARDAMLSGGTMSLKMENRSFDGEKDMGLRGEYVEVRFVDTGTGIAPEHIARVFEPFFTTKEIGRGTGLGLSQVYGFAQHCGGTVRISSEVNRGTAVSIYLPRTHEALSKRSSESAMEEHAPVTGAVLIVEDNKQVGEVSAALVEQVGYEAIGAGNAQEALSILNSRSDIVLIFSDIVMPGDMDGVALARMVRERFPHIPVLLTSGYAKMAEAAEKEFPLLRKPYEVSALARAVRTAIERAG